ncbi:zf-CSL-domain-containing protein [Tricholoma matsutake]|nr:zf-CSL-domain-containing protein [Tricholoma matsutake 945]
MGAYYDEIEIEDMAWDANKGVYHYPCPCGDRFEISRTQLAEYEDIATCPSCSLVIRVIYDPLDFEDELDEPDGDEEEEESEEEEHFEDAMEKLKIDEMRPQTVSVDA